MTPKPIPQAQLIRIIARDGDLSSNSKGGVEWMSIPNSASSSVGPGGNWANGSCANVASLSRKFTQFTNTVKMLQN